MRPTAEEIYQLVRVDLDTCEKNASGPATPAPARSTPFTFDVRPPSSVSVPSGASTPGPGSTGTASVGGSSGLLRGSAHSSDLGTVAELPGLVLASGLPPPQDASAGTAHNPLRDVNEVSPAPLKALGRVEDGHPQQPVPLARQSPPPNPFGQAR